MENEKLYIGAAAVILIIGLLAVSGIFSPANENDIISRKANFNVNEVSYKVAVGKPEVALFDGAAEDVSEKTGSEVTVYNQNLALVKDVRKIMMENGVNLVYFKDIASQIDATSVFFRDLTYPDTFVVEQNYEYDIVNKSKILEKYLDKEITVQVEEGNSVNSYTGTLLSYNDGIVLQTDSGIIALNSSSKISFPELPDGLLTKPTLVWKVFADKAGERNTETAYLTGGMDWKADYIAIANTEDTAIDLAGWATITNNSGTSYPDSKLKLVAGDIHRVNESPRYPELYEYAMDAGVATKEQFGEEALFEYHLYTLDRKTDIMNNQTKQISLLSTDNVPVKKEFVYDGRTNGEKVEVRLNFKNSESQGLGMPMPKGTVRVYKKDSDGQLQFLGEDSIDHTKKEDDVDLLVGNAFDVSGKWEQTNYENVAKGIWRESYKITLENQKDTAVSIKVKEHLYGSWEIRNNSDSYEKKNANEIDYIVNVPAGGTKEITYTVEYRSYY